MSSAGEPDPAAPDDRDVNRGVALLRLALLPIALVELPNRPADLAADIYPFLVAILAVYAVTLLLLSFRAEPRMPPPAVQALTDLALISALVYTSGGASSPLRFSFYVLPIIAAVRLSPRLTAAWTGLALAAYLVVTIPHPASRLPADLTLVLDESLTLIWVGAAAVMLSALVGRRARSFAALAASRRELVRQSLNAEAGERHRLAQVLHDDAIQNVLLARQEVTDLEHGVPGAAERIQNALDETYRQLRDEVFAMHPVGLERAGPAAVLQHYCEQAGRRGHFEAHVHVDPATGELGDELLYASAREVLTNIAKHARANNVEVALDVCARQLQLKVSDDGVGFAPERLGDALAGGHIGLASVGERVRAVGGDLLIDSTIGRGTTVIVKLPII